MVKQGKRSKISRLPILTMSQTGSEEEEKETDSESPVSDSPIVTLLKEADHLDSEIRYLKTRYDTVQSELGSWLKEFKEKQSSSKIYLELEVLLGDLELQLKDAAYYDEFKVVDEKLKSIFKEHFLDSPTPTFLTRDDSLKLTKKDFDEGNLYVWKEVHKKKKNFAKVFLRNNRIIFGDWQEEIKEENHYSLVDFFDFINSRTTVIDSHKYGDEHKEVLTNPKYSKQRLKYSKIVAKDETVYLHSFKKTKGNGYTIVFDRFIRTLGCYSSLPTDVFLKIQRSSTAATLGEIVITADWKRVMGKNFILLASGIFETDLEGTLFSCLTEEPYQVEGGKWYIEDNLQEFNGPVDLFGFKRHLKKEMVRGAVAGTDNGEFLTSSFRICKKDLNFYSNEAFGTVKSGMDLVDRLEEEEDVVMECGFVFDFR